MVFEIYHMWGGIFVNFEIAWAFQPRKSHGIPRECGIIFQCVVFFFLCINFISRYIAKRITLFFLTACVIFIHARSFYQFGAIDSRIDSLLRHVITRNLQFCLQAGSYTGSPSALLLAGFTVHARGIT